MPGRPVSILSLVYDDGLLSVPHIRSVDLFFLDVVITFPALENHHVIYHFFSVRVALELMDTRVRKESQEAVLDLATL